MEKVVKQISKLIPQSELGESTVSQMTAAKFISHLNNLILSAFNEGEDYFLLRYHDPSKKFLEDVREILEEAGGYRTEVLEHLDKNVSIKVFLWKAAEDATG